MNDMNGNWTLDELTAEVALALSTDYAGQSNGQVSDIPNRRTIRYYTTLGLVDRPGRMRGRTGLYGRRHLLQLVAIKRLQVRGQRLSEIQERLSGASNGELQAIARIREAGDETAARLAEVPGRAHERAGGSRGRDGFWRDPPVAAAQLDLGPHDAADGPGRITPLLGLALDLGVTLLVPARRSLGEDDLAAVRAAARPLINLLTQRGLVDPAEGGGR